MHKLHTCTQVQTSQPCASTNTTTTHKSKHHNFTKANTHPIHPKTKIPSQYSTKHSHTKALVNHSHLLQLLHQREKNFSSLFSINLFQHHFHQNTSQSLNYSKKKNKKTFFPLSSLPSLKQIQSHSSKTFNQVLHFQSL